MNDQLVLTVNQDLPRTRLTTFFRLILAIPHLLLAAIWGIGALLAAIVAWFAIVFTGQYPPGLWNFCAGWVRYVARVYLYTYLATDAFPPFNGDQPYAASLHVPQLGQYDRLKTGFRFLYIIPAYLAAAILGYVLYVVAFVDWLIIVITGQQVPGLQAAILFCVGWSIRVAGLATLVTEDYGLVVQEGMPAAFGGPTPEPI